MSAHHLITGITADQCSKVTVRVLENLGFPPSAKQNALPNTNKLPKPITQQVIKKVTEEVFEIFIFMVFNLRHLNWDNKNEFSGEVGTYKERTGDGNKKLGDHIVYGQLFKEKWRDSKIHFEWDDLFGNIDSNSLSWKFSIHMEGQTKSNKKNSANTLLTPDELRNEIGKKFQPHSKHSGKLIWERDCCLNKPFIQMNDEEIRYFIETSHKEIPELSKIIDEFLK
jgi:hypothetical protein